MDAETYIRIGGGPFIPSSQITDPIKVRENDKLTIRVDKLEDDSPPDIYLEDYRIALKDEPIYEDGRLVYETDEGEYFKESFGYAFIRVDYMADSAMVPFDVLIKERDAKRVQEMLEYIKSRNFDIMKACFSRSTRGVDMLPDDRTEPEALLSQAEKILSEFQSLKADFLQGLRQRLVPALVPAWTVSETNVEIDPFNVINNLDSLMPTTAGHGQVFVKGRYFDFSSADIMSLLSSSDVYENRVVLGGFYSMRRRIQSLRKELTQVHIEDNGTFYGYESFTRLMLELTAEGMVSRCDRILLACDQLIRLLEKKHSITFAGELKPTITPYVRASKTYRKVFTLFAAWYELGNPILEGLKFLMKLRSVSRLYEIFTMIKLIEYFVDRGWVIEDAREHAELGESVPSFIRFSYDKVVLKLYYDKKIHLFDERTTNHHDLVDTYHKPTANYPYYHPDYIVRIEEDDNVKYVILDAKYSSQSTVKTYSMQPLYEKYYERAAVYDRSAGTLQNGKILSVLAIHAIPGAGNNYYSYWPNRGIFSRLTKVPMVGAVALTPDSLLGFDDVLDKTLEISHYVRC